MNILIVIRLFCIEILIICFNSQGLDVNKVTDPEIKIKQVNIVDYLPRHYAKDGTVDYTTYIQEAIDKNDNLTFPEFPLLVNSRGLTIGSNKTIVFLKGSKLRMQSNSKTHYSVLNLNDVSNVKLHNPVIVGDRYEHLGSKGEWGMGISIKGCENIEIYGSKISNCWGDGIYLGQTNANRVNRNIVIKNAHLTKNRRDGISIISVDGLVLENVFSSFHDGTKPMCGINFEPNNPSCRIKNVKVVNPRTEHNKGSGIQIGLRTLLGRGLQKVDIKIINHIDIGSQSFAMKVAANRKPGIVGGSIDGLVTIIKPSWYKTIGDRPLAFVTDQPNLKVIVVSPKVKNSNGMELGLSGIKAILNKHSNGDLRIL